MLVTFSTLRAAEKALAASQEMKGGAAPDRSWAGEVLQNEASLEGAWLSSLLQATVQRAARSAYA